MCGIFFSCHPCNQECSTDKVTIKKFMERRGPDWSEEISNVTHGSYSFNFMATVLHLRGQELVKQPLTDEEGNILLWNGENFNCGSNEEDESDSLDLSNKIKTCTSDKSMIECISLIRGPFAFVYWQKGCSKLWFGRDIVGRRSLCWRIQEEPFQLSLCSICDVFNKGWQEVPANGVYYVDFAQDVPKIICTKWSKDACGTDLDSSSWLSSLIITSFNQSCPSLEPDILDLDDEAVDQFIDVLEDAVYIRVTKFNQKCKNCLLSQSMSCDHSSVAILFSGGLDSTVLALLSHKFIPSHQSIDLLNVSFSDNSPDRQTGEQEYQELKKLAPQRRWNFVAIDVSLDELKHQRDQHIKYLLKPLNTVLDDSIGCALWFASKGSGSLRFGCNSSEEYHSPARVILLGMGADEQLAGYSRHRKVFQGKGWQGLVEQIKMEINGISTRNLGRDDRILSDHGREARFPFLDEAVMSFLNSLPIWKKANLTLERGRGEKLLLRLVATKLGLTNVATCWKRAIQFGSRIAHLEGKGEKGQNQCIRLDAI